MYKYEDIRNFYFENEKGQRIDCQKVNGGLFLYNVTGLGYEENIEYKRIGNTFIQNNKEIVQNQITGELEFYDMTYDEYRNFIDFILMATSLRLVYIPKTSNRTEYYRDIDVCKIEKTEEDEYNILTCPIVINCKSLWYEQKEIIYTVEADEEEFRWDFYWDIRFMDYANRTITFTNNGHVDASIEVEMEGSLINPSILVTVDGNKYAEFKLNGTIGEYEKLLYSSKQGDLYIMREKVDGTTENLFKKKYIDINNKNIFRLPQRKF